MPFVSGGPCKCACVFLFCTRSCGCIEHPAFPAPSIFRRREKFQQNSGEAAPRDRGGAPRHCEPTGQANARPMTGGSAKQSRPSTRQELDCFVATLLAMTELAV